MGIDALITIFKKQEQKRYTCIWLHTPVILFFLYSVFPLGIKWKLKNNTFIYKKCNYSSTTSCIPNIVNK